MADLFPESLEKLVEGLERRGSPVSRPILFPVRGSTPLFNMISKILGRLK